MIRSPRQPLKTKFYIPQVRPALIHRQRLISRINAGIQKTLTLISAPAGFGKTTLLAEWAAQSDLPLAWISLDGEDNDPARFAACLLFALEAAGALRAETLAAAQNTELLPAPAVLEAILADLDSSPRPLGIVLDDYHLIHQQAVHDLLIFILEHLPPPLRLVISTRADPPVRLARLRARGEITELRAEDLRFSVDEATAFFAQGMGLELDPAAVAALEQRTEGWIAGMQLAALSMQGRKDTAAFIQAFSGSHRYILDYLLEEVLNQQPEAVQQFLMRTAVLDPMCASLCDALNDAPSGSQSLLESLERSNLFIIPLDDERRWYRYHHLFADLLRARLQLLSPERIPALHARAAAWLDQNGYPLEAVQHAFAAQDYELAAGMMEQNGLERWSFSDMTYLGLLSRLPPENLSSRPTLGIYLAWTHILFGRLKAAQEVLDGVVRHLPVNAGPDMEGMRGFCTLLFAYIQTMSATAAEIHLPARQVLEFIPERLLAMRNSADVIYARLLSYQGNFEEAAEILSATVRRDMAANGTNAVPICISFLSRLRAIQGRLHAAADLCREYLDYIAARGSQRFYIAGNLSIALAEVLLEWNDLDEAEVLAREGIRSNASWNIPHAVALGYLVLAAVQLAREDPTEADQSLRHAQAAVEERVIPLDLTNELRALRLKVEMARGTLPSSQSWAEHLPQDYASNYLWELDAILLARLLIAEGQSTQALAVLAQLKQRAEAGKRTGRLIKILFLQAICLFTLSQPTPAFAVLRACLELAEAEGYQRSFLEEGEPGRELLAAYLRTPHPARRDYIQRLLGAFHLAPAGRLGAIPSHPGHPGHPGHLGHLGHPGHPDLVEPLTGRELEVLRCLKAGDSNQDIALKLSVSVSAVKKHAGNIYGKLGAGSRTQAIARARELGII